MSVLKRPAYHFLGVLLALSVASTAQAQPASEPPAKPGEPITASVAEPGEPLVAPPAEPAPNAPIAASAEAAASSQAQPEPGGAAWDYLDEGAPAPTAEEVDLASLGVAADEESDKFPKLDIYGFSDLTFSMPVNKKGNAWDFFLPPQSTFYVGNINLYVASQMSKVLRSLLEVRFTYLPHGKNRSGLEVAPSQPYVDTSAQDYTEAERPLKLGAIEIERVQLEYAPVGWLSIVAGQWLTPYGIWNVDHGSPTTIDTHKPYVIGEQYLPERQTGLLLQGAVRSGMHRFGYNLGLSNGRGPLDSYYDMDSNKALTGHLSWQSNTWFGDLTLGISGYAGRYTNSQRALSLAAGAESSLQLKTIDTVNEQYDEYSFAADAKWVRGGFQVFSEAIMNTKRYTDKGRPAPQGSFVTLIAPTKTDILQPDTRRMGVYLIGGYRFQWLGIMPYAQLEYVRLGSADLPATAAATVGLNIRPHESVTLKLHYGHATFPGADKLGPGRDSIGAFATQIAWAF